MICLIFADVSFLIIARGCNTSLGNFFRKISLEPRCSRDNYNFTGWVRTNSFQGKFCFGGEFRGQIWEATNLGVTYILVTNLGVTNLRVANLKVANLRVINL